MSTQNSYKTPQEVRVAPGGLAGTRSLPEPFPETLIEVDGDEGSVRLDAGYRLTISGRGRTERRSVEPVLPSWAEKPSHGVQESVRNIQQHWVECLPSGQEPSTSGADNLKTFALAEAAYASAADGGRTVDIQTFCFKGLHVPQFER